MSMTFRERMVVLQIGAIVAVYALYGLHFWGRPLTSLSALTLVGVLIGVTILMTLIGIVGGIALAVYRRPEQRDERDRAVQLRGARNAYYALAVGVWCVLLLSIAPVPHGVLFATLLGAFGLAELVRLGSELIYYRAGP
jgi:hypothetical protein